jgi:transcription initiation factor IIE alpha subunit
VAKLKYEDIKAEVESEGWKLLSDSYNNLKTQMNFQCPNGHENYFTMEYWRRHKQCPICKSNKYYQMNDSAPKSKGFRILAFD